MSCKCVDCKHCKDNPDYDYYKNDRADLCFCDIESEFWEGDISAALGDQIECPDYEKKESLLGKEIGECLIKGVQEGLQKKMPRFVLDKNNMAILDTNNMEWICGVSTKRPDLFEEKINGLLDKANKYEECLKELENYKIGVCLYKKQTTEFIETLTNITDAESFEEVNKLAYEMLNKFDD